MSVSTDPTTGDPSIVPTSAPALTRELSAAATWERYEMRVHKRLIDMGLDERALRLVMRVPIPEGLNIEIEMIDA